MNDNSVALAALTLAGTIAAGFFALVNKQNKTHEKLANAMDKMVDSSKEIVKETKRGNDQSEERNGHLGELILKSGKAATKHIDAIPKKLGEIADQQAKAILAAVDTIKEQHVEHQIVGEIHVEKIKEVKK